MGINVVLEDEGGEQIDAVHDPRGVISRLARVAHGDPSYRLLCYVDPWGDTVFNTLQIEDLIRDLQVARGRSQADDDRALLTGVIALTERVDGREGPHLYIRFVGD